MRLRALQTERIVSASWRANENENRNTMMKIWLIGLIDSVVRSSWILFTDRAPLSGFDEAVEIALLC
jgi:hypothetical protein